MQLAPRPNQRPQSVSPTARQTSQQSSIQLPPTPLSHQKKSFRLTKKQLIAAALLLALLVAGCVGYGYLSNQVMSDRYQAVFLNNGQVYFGKLHGYYGNKPYMTDVHYFQANSQTAATESNSANQLLVKLGSEVHSPEGKLILNKDAILFVENLTEGSKVTEAIKKETDASSESTIKAETITR